MESESSKRSNKKDPGWKYNHAKDPKKKNYVTCNFCGFTSSNGIYRAKQHQMGVSRDVKPCEKVPSELKEELPALYRKRPELNVRNKQNEPDVNAGDDADDVEVVQAKRNSRGKRALGAIPGFSKAKKTKIVMDLSPQKPGEVVDMSKKQGKLRQTSMNDSTDAARERTIQCIARFFGEAGIPFEAAKRDSFMDMVKAISQYDLGLKPPSSHELSVSPNKKKMQLTKNLWKNQEKWAKTNEDESTYDAAGSSGGPTAQPSPHSEEELNVRKKQNEPDVNIGDDADDVEVEQAKWNSRGKRALVAIPGSSKAKKTKDLYLQKPGERTIQLKNNQEKWAKSNEDENTYDAAGSTGGPTAQSSPHNEEFQPKKHMATFCGMPVIEELWKAFDEAYGEINTETSKGKTEEEQEFSEELKLLDECFPDITEEGEKWLDECCKRELISKWQERLEEFFEEEGITEKFTKKFKAVCLKYVEEVKRQCSEDLEQIFKEGDPLDVDVILKFYPELLTAGSLNVSSNCEGELQSSSTRTTPLTANAMKSLATGGKPHHDPLAMQGVATAAAESSGAPTT